MIRIPTLAIAIRPSPPTLALLGRADTGVIPAVIQVILIALTSNALAAVPDIEETADSHGYEDDDKAEDWHGDDHGEIHV